MLSNSLQFWSYLFLLIPAIILSIFVLYCLLTDRHITRSIHNHIIILLLFIGLIYILTVYPLKLHFSRKPTDEIPTVAFCYAWNFLDWFLANTQNLLFAWASIERYLLVFHNHLLSTRIKRILIHYLPMIIIPLYSFIYMIIIYFFPPCDNIIDLTQVPCMILCVYSSHTLAVYEATGHTILPVFIIALFNSCLCIQFVLHKSRMQLPVRWRQHRKVICQMLIISSMYLSIGIPFAIMMILQKWMSTSLVSFDTLLIAAYFCYYPTLILPLLIACISSEVRHRLKMICRFIRRRNHKIVPQYNQHGKMIRR